MSTNGGSLPTPGDLHLIHPETGAVRVIPAKPPPRMDAAFAATFSQLCERVENLTARLPHIQNGYEMMVGIDRQLKQVLAENAEIRRRLDALEGKPTGSCRTGAEFLARTREWPNPNLVDPLLPPSSPDKETP